MDTADIVIRYYRDGEPVESPAPTGDEDRDIGAYEDRDIVAYEDFVLSATVQRRCTADNTLVGVESVGGVERARCANGHRWTYVATEPLVRDSAPGWRQVS